MMWTPEVCFLVHTYMASLWGMEMVNTTTLWGQQRVKL